MNVSKQKSIYVQLDFTHNQLNQNQFFSPQNQTYTESNKAKCGRVQDYISKVDIDQILRSFKLWIHNKRGGYYTGNFLLFLLFQSRYRSNA